MRFAAWTNPPCRMGSIFITGGDGGGRGGGPGSVGLISSAVELMTSRRREPMLFATGDDGRFGIVGSSIYAITFGMDSGAVSMFGSAWIDFWIRGCAEKTSTCFGTSNLGASKD